MNAVVTENVVLDKFTAVDFLINDSGRRILLNDISWAEYERFWKISSKDRAGV